MNQKAYNILNRDRKSKDERGDDFSKQLKTPRCCSRLLLPQLYMLLMGLEAGKYCTQPCIYIILITIFIYHNKENI